jgi:hypothetical protein
MKRYIKSFSVLVFLLGVGTSYCSAGTYTPKQNPQHSVQYEEAPEVYLTAGQCKNYSRQNYPDKVVRCRAMLFSHFYLNGEIVDGRMDEIAKIQMVGDALLFIFVLIFIGVAFYVYMIPTFTAYNRNHPQRVFIMMLNLFLGNTLVGWIAALIWARSGGENENARENGP